MLQNMKPDFMNSNPTGIAAMREIRETGKLEAETEDKLKETLNAYTENFLKRK